MEFKFPESHPVEIEIEGVKHKGSFYFLLGQMVVNFKGHISSQIAPKGEPDGAAKQMLKTLVQEHYVSICEIPSEWPEEMRQAAYAYINSGDDESSLDDLICSLGDPQHRGLAFKQIAILCLKSLEVVVPAWKEICDNNELEETTSELWKWLENPDHIVNWEAACEPRAALRHGKKIEDCDVCRAEPLAEAVAATATFLRTSNIESAFDALSSVSAAHDEGCHPDDELESFPKRLVFSLLPSVLAHGKE